MKTEKIITGALLILGILQASAQDTATYLSLKQSCQLGIEKNVNVLNGGLEQQKTTYQLAEAKSKLYPQVEAYSDFNYYYAIPKMVLPGEIFGKTGMIAVQIGTKYDWSSGFKASQVLYDQSYLTSLKLSQRLVTIGELTLQQKKEEVIYQVSQVYYLCQATRMQIQQLKITMQNTNRMQEIAKLKSENGIILKVDYSRVSVNKNNLQTQIDNLDQLYQQQLSLLKYLIGLNVATKVELSDSLNFSTVKASHELPDFKNRIELQLLDKQIEVTSLTRKFNQQSYLPTLSGIGQFYYQGQRDAFDFFKGKDKFYNVGLVGLSLNIPIFDGYEKYAKIKQKEIELQQLQNNRKNTSDYFTKEYADAARQYDNSMNILLRQQENIKVAEDTYNISMQGYRQQVVLLSDLLLSENSLTEARLSYYNSLLQLKNAELDVKKAKGELLNY